jgi:hypothetical protein
MSERPNEYEVEQPPILSETASPAPADDDPIRAALTRYSGVDQDAEAGLRLHETLIAERNDAMAVLLALAQRSPFFVTINHGADDVDTCQFCLEDRRHAPDCPWLLVEAIAAGKPAFPTPAMLQALYEADEALTAVFNSHATLPDGMIVQIERAGRRCRAAGTKLPWPGEIESEAGR